MLALGGPRHPIARGAGNFRDVAGTNATTVPEVAKLGAHLIVCKAFVHARQRKAGNVNFFHRRHLVLVSLYAEGRRRWVGRIRDLDKFTVGLVIHHSASLVVSLKSPWGGWYRKVSQPAAR